MHHYKNTLPSLPPIDQTVNEKETKSVLLLYLKYQQTAHEPAETVLESVMSTKAAMRAVTVHRLPIFYNQTEY